MDISIESAPLIFTPSLSSDPTATIILNKSGLDITSSSRAKSITKVPVPPPVGLKLLLLPIAIYLSHSTLSEVVLHIAVDLVEVSESSFPG